MKPGVRSVSARSRASSIRVRGLVQGVGFRPTVAKVARSLGLAGSVLNDSEGVLIHVEGEAVDAFLHTLMERLPPLARVDAVDVQPAEPRGYDGFAIVESGRSQTPSTGVVADAGVCPECREETLSSHERRYRYPFTNCTHCGPRFSIIEGIPYDRSQTTMRAFEMCAACAAEYGDDLDRRYHAQPIACHVCGPRAWLERADGTPVVSSMFSGLDDVDAVATLIQQGEIVAIRGIGGYHLACDATLAPVVTRLRERKSREGKPLALMARDRDVIEGYAVVSDAEWQALSAPSAPIVLLERRADPSQAARAAPRELRLQSGEGGRPPAEKTRVTPALAEAVTQDSHLVGFMLPYTPLHLLLMERLSTPVVMTSGNLSDEPQCTSVAEARARLSTIADYFLHHDREIAHRVDDSVVRVSGARPTVLRHARGFSPRSLLASAGGRVGLAMGGDLKSAVALSRGNDLILSQHLGDLDEPSTRDDYERAIARYLELFEVEPDFVAVDAHPGYVSRRLGEELARRLGASVVEVQHHHAHVAACLAEHRCEDAVVGIVLDGIGWGDDGTPWGAEVLVADLAGYERCATLTPRALLGGDRAAKEPWRNAYAHLVEGLGWDELERYAELEPVADLLRRPRAALDSMLTAPGTVRASSAGRLFDAVAAVLNLHRERIGHEAEAATALEARAEQSKDGGAYPFAIVEDSPLQLDALPMWRALLNDVGEGVECSVIARRFHAGLAEGFTQLAERTARMRDLSTVVLSGGCFANSLLTNELTRRLEARGLEVVTHRFVPPGDGGLAVGQAAIARRRSV